MYKRLITIIIIFHTNPAVRGKCLLLSSSAQRSQTDACKDIQNSHLLNMIHMCEIDGVRLTMTGSSLQVVISVRLLKAYHSSLHSFCVSLQLILSRCLLLSAQQRRPGALS